MDQSEQGSFQDTRTQYGYPHVALLYPHLAAVWNPYSWLLEKRFVLAETSLSPQGWPAELDPLRVLLISDIHCGIFLKLEPLATIIGSLMELKPDLVAISGDIVTGHSNEVNKFLDILAPLSHAPLGAWYCYGNHDYFGGDPEDIRKDLKSIGITTLKNESVLLTHGKGSFVLGGIDDRIMGAPDWGKTLAQHGAPHLLLAHNPDFFYEAEAHRVPLTLSGHTHGGQIRLPHSGPILRQSRFCLDEGNFAFGSCCWLCHGDSAVSGFPGVGVPTLKPCSSKSFRHHRQSADRWPLPRATDAATAPRLKTAAARNVTFIAPTNPVGLSVVGLAPASPV